MTSFTFYLIRLAAIAELESLQGNILVPHISPKNVVKAFLIIAKVVHKGKASRMTTEKYIFFCHSSLRGHLSENNWGV